MVFDEKLACKIIDDSAKEIERLEALVAQLKAGQVSGIERDSNPYWHNEISVSTTCPLSSPAALRLAKLAKQSSAELHDIMNQRIYGDERNCVLSLRRPWQERLRDFWRRVQCAWLVLRGKADIS